jgi:hypothetical protein
MKFIEQLVANLFAAHNYLLFEQIFFDFNAYTDTDDVSAKCVMDPLNQTTQQSKVIKLSFLSSKPFADTNSSLFDKKAVVGNLHKKQIFIGF